jgi:outer membrane protein
MRLAKIGFVTTIMIVICFATSSIAADVAKIGVINLQRVLQTSSAGKEAYTEIKKQKEDMENELQGKMDEIAELRKQLERNAMVISKEMRDEKEREMRIKVNDIKTLQEKYKNDLKQLEGRHLTRIQKELSEIIIKIGTKEGYLLIVSQVSVLYAPTSIDITDVLIKEYNAKFAQQ